MSVLVALISFIIFLFFQARGIAAGDSGDLVTAAATFGVAHPPGYPLYTWLGWLFTHIPLFTISWRVTLLSSIAHAITVAIVFSFVARWSRNMWSGLFAASLLFGNYLFFLYSTTAEVFALLDAFLMLLLWNVAKVVEKPTRWRLFLLAFLLGLSLSHHHMILFSVPSILVSIWPVRKIVYSFRGVLTMIVCFCVGLVPYFYIPVAASGNAPINWDHATTGKNFFRLVTRADYGTFQSGAIIGEHPVERFYQLAFLWQYMLLDFRIPGFFFILVGFWYLYQKKRKLFSLFALCMFFLGPFFFFYASFPVANRFTQGTYERFLLPLYVVMCVVAGFGHAWMIRNIVRRFRKLVSPTAMQIAVAGFIVVTFAYGGMLGGITLWRFSGWSRDMTAENFARDVFADVPKHSMLALGRDTTLFTVQYVRYALLYRDDTFVIHASFLNDPAYRETLRRIFPSLVYPQDGSNVNEYLSRFLIANSQERQVFSNNKYPMPEGWIWVPHGLLYQLFPDTSVPGVQVVEEQNVSRWDSLHDPRAGILSRYRHLMLSDVLDVYSAARVDFGKVLLHVGDISEAQHQFREAIAVDGDTQTPQAFTYLGISQVLAKQCDEAIRSFDAAKNALLIESNELALYEAITYRDCLNDQVSAKRLFDEYESKQKIREQPLEGW